MFLSHVWIFYRSTTCWWLIVLADGYVEYLSRYSFRFGLGSVAVGSAYSTYSENTNQQANPVLDWFSFEFLVVPLCERVTLTGSDNGFY